MAGNRGATNFGGLNLEIAFMEMGGASFDSETFGGFAVSPAVFFGRKSVAVTTSGMASPLRKKARKARGSPNSATSFFHAESDLFGQTMLAFIVAFDLVEHDLFPLDKFMYPPQQYFYLGRYLDDLNKKGARSANMFQSGFVLKQK